MFSKETLKLDAERAVESITKTIRDQIGSMRKRGAVVGLSGGIDSSVTCALSVKALGKERVFGIFMPEKDTSDDAYQLGSKLAQTYGIETTLENLGPTLKALGCYERQVEAIRTVEPAFGEGWKFKLVLPSILEHERLNVTRLVVQSPSGESKTHRLSAGAYSQIVAATNYKQRLRKVTEYYHGDRLNYAVAGTPNRLEYDQGFFVKLGDGSADFKPIAHLYKTQVFQLAEFLGVPAEIRARTPTTDTFSLPQTQEEFYFSLPYDKMDMCLYGLNHNVPIEEVAAATGITVEQVGRVYKDIEAKRRGTHYLHLPPQLIEKVAEVQL
jgi:NAD+ synthase